jgi:hypothetical protein
MPEPFDLHTTHAPGEALFITAGGGDEARGR